MWHTDVSTRFSSPFINRYRILATITLRLSGINLFVSTNWNDRAVSPRRDNSSGRIPESMTNFPKPVVRSGGPPYSPGACRRAPGLFISQHALFYHGSTSFVVRFSYEGETRRRQVQIYKEDVSRACLSLWPRGINNISRDLLEFLRAPSPPRICPSRPRGPPVEEIASLTCTLRAAILMDTRDSMGTKGCWFNVEGVFVVLMRYNRMDPGCWCIARSGVPRASAGPPLVETPVDSGRNTSITCHGYVFRHISLSYLAYLLSLSPSVTPRILHPWTLSHDSLASSSYCRSVAC